MEIDDGRAILLCLTEDGQYIPLVRHKVTKLWSVRRRHTAPCAGRENGGHVQPMYGTGPTITTSMPASCRLRIVRSSCLLSTVVLWRLASAPPDRRRTLL